MKYLFVAFIILVPLFIHSQPYEEDCIESPESRVEALYDWKGVYRFFRHKIKLTIDIRYIVIGTDTIQVNNVFNDRFRNQSRFIRLNEEWGISFFLYRIQSAYGKTYEFDIRFYRKENCWYHYVFRNKLDNEIVKPLSGEIALKVPINNILIVPDYLDFRFYGSIEIR